MNSKEKFYLTKQAGWKKWLAAPFIATPAFWGGKYLYDKKQQIDDVLAKAQTIDPSDIKVTVPNVEEEVAAGQDRIKEEVGKQLSKELGEANTTLKGVAGGAQKNMDSVANSAKLLAILAGTGGLAAGGGYLYNQLKEKEEDEEEEFNRRYF